MLAVIVLLLIAALVLWLLHERGTVQTRTSGPDADRRAATVQSRRLGKIGDPRLAATVLMLQLVRTGAPPTAAEKTAIMELMEDPLGIANVEATFVRAWGLTDGSRAFSPVADDLVPMLRRKLTAAEQRQFVDMLRTVAGAYGEPSELQREAIDRLQRRLAATEADAAPPVGAALRE